MAEAIKAGEQALINIAQNLVNAAKNTLNSAMKSFKENVISSKKIDFKLKVNEAQMAQSRVKALKVATYEAEKKSNEAITKYEAGEITEKECQKAVDEFEEKTNAFVKATDEYGVKVKEAQEAAQEYLDAKNGKTQITTKNAKRMVRKMAAAKSSDAVQKITDAVGNTIGGIREKFDTEGAKKAFTKIQEQAKKFKLDPKIMSALSSTSGIGKPGQKMEAAKQAYMAQYGKVPDNDTMDILNVKYGNKTQEEYIAEKQTEWEKKNNNSTYTSKTEAQPATTKEEGAPSANPEPRDRDNQHVVSMSPDKTGIVINENTSSNPNTLLINYKGQTSYISMDDDGIHLNTKRNVTIHSDSSFDQKSQGDQTISITGGNYNINVTGDANINTTGNFNVTAKDINFKANNDFYVSTPNGTLNLISNSNMFLASQNEIEAWSQGDFKATSSGGALHLKSGSQIFLDSGNIKTQCGGAQGAEKGKGAKTSHPTSRDV